MLIDINASIGHWPFEQTDCNTCQALVERMNQFGVDVSVVSNMNGIFYKDTQSANEELYREIISKRSFRNRIIPFAVINPTYAGWRKDLDICITKMGMKGIRLYPLYHDYLLTDPSCTELVKIARDRGLIVALTHRMVENRAARSWMDLSNQLTMNDIIPLIREVPEGKYFILNVISGMQMNDKDTKLFKAGDLLFDTSGKGITNLAELLNKFGKEKFAYGSHSPILDQLTGLLRIETLNEKEADEGAKELMRSGNAKRMLGI